MFPILFGIKGYGEKNSLTDKTEELNQRKQKSFLSIYEKK